MDFKYNPCKSRNTELLRYLVENKINTANKIFEERKSYPLGPEDKKFIALEYINNLFNIKKGYCSEVIGLDSYTRELALNTMARYNVTSTEVNNYIESNMEGGLGL